MIKKPDWSDVELVTSAEAAEAAFVVCVLYRADEGLLLPDNVLARCCDCNRRVQLRPDVPPEPRRICLECALANMEAQQ